MTLSDKLRVPFLPLAEGEVLTPPDVPSSGISAAKRLHSQYLASAYFWELDACILTDRGKTMSLRAGETLSDGQYDTEAKSIPWEEQLTQVELTSIEDAERAAKLLGDIVLSVVNKRNLKPVLRLHCTDTPLLASVSESITFVHRCAEERIQEYCDKGSRLRSHRIDIFRDDNRRLNRFWVLGYDVLILPAVDGPGVTLAFNPFMNSTRYNSVVDVAVVGRYNSNGSAAPLAANSELISRFLCCLSDFYGSHWIPHYKSLMSEGDGSVSCVDLACPGIVGCLIPERYWNLKYIKAKAMTPVKYGTFSGLRDGALNLDEHDEHEKAIASPVIVGMSPSPTERLPDMGPISSSQEVRYMNGGGKGSGAKSHKVGCAPGDPFDVLSFLLSAFDPGDPASEARTREGSSSVSTAGESPSRSSAQQLRTSAPSVAQNTADSPVSHDKKEAIAAGLHQVVAKHNNQIDEKERFDPVNFI